MCISKHISEDFYILKIARNMGNMGNSLKHKDVCHSIICKGKREEQLNVPLSLSGKSI